MSGRFFGRQYSIAHVWVAIVASGAADFGDSWWTHALIFAAVLTAGFFPAEWATNKYGNKGDE